MLESKSHAKAWLFCICFPLHQSIPAIQHIGAHSLKLRPDFSFCANNIKLSYMR
ncbi:hypothetical protein JCM19237_4268 [Photobacterium aphoticum]|uniref:Uncharacterized protein n=1 Tax=Photobacterium aphoticum TaxID=754436 RepID=A0A090RBE6_9GAMM|nr:hypothetical protein JCM19237_4268 [Photobacterium aphoticum]